MFPIFAAIGAALAAVAIPVAKAVALGAVSGAAAYGATKAIEAAADSKAAPGDVPKNKPDALNAVLDNPEVPADSQPLVKPATSLRPAWAALENEAPEPSHSLEKPVINKAEPMEPPVQAQAPVVIATPTLPVVTLPYSNPVSTSPVMRL